MIFFSVIPDTPLPRRKKSNQHIYIVQLLFQSRMNSQTIFCNDDIICEVWKHVKIDSLKQLSVVSKDYNSHFKNMSDIDYLCRKYKEEDNNLSAFVAKTSKEICKKYHYGTPKFLNVLTAFFDNKVTEKEKKDIGGDIYLIYYWIILILHIVNNNYKEILLIAKKIKYENKLDKPIIQLFLKILGQHSFKIFGKGYCKNKNMLLRYLSIGHMILFGKHQFSTNKGYVETLQRKKIELVNGIKKFEIKPNRWLFPKRFCLELIEIIGK